MFIGYVLDRNGYYDCKYYFEESLDNIAKFITQNFQNETIITDQGDNLICKSLIGGYLDIADDEILHELLPVILEYQKGKDFKAIDFYLRESGVYFEIRQWEV